MSLPSREGWGQSTIVSMVGHRELLGKQMQVNGLSRECLVQRLGKWSDGDLGGGLLSRLREHNLIGDAQVKIGRWLALGAIL